MHAEGFDHVRIPAGWHHYTGPGPEFRIRREFFGRVDELVHAGLREGIAVLINIHHFDEFTSNPKEQTPRFLAIWRQIAEHYSKAPDGLAFELLNEPKDAATTEIINPIFAEAIRQIRRIDPKRTIFLGPSKWNSISELPKLQLPGDDDNLIVTVHNYEPFYFTHQGANWAGPDTKVTGILFPGPPAKPLSLDPGLKVNSWVLDWIKAYNTQPTATNPSSPRALPGRHRTRPENGRNTTAARSMWVSSVVSRRLSPSRGPTTTAPSGSRPRKRGLVGPSGTGRPDSITGTSRQTSLSLVCTTPYLDRCRPAQYNE